MTIRGDGKQIRAAAAISLCAWLAGCDAASDGFKTDASRWLNPTQLVRKRETASVNRILDTYGSADQSQDVIPAATPPRPEDYVYTDKDYEIGPTDILDISVLDLFRDGQETLLRREVSESGFVDLPLLEERIYADGLTKEELKDRIIDAYSPTILVDPTVSVSVVARRQSVYTVVGAVDRAGVFPIRQKGMRLLEAIGQAGGITQPNIRYIYVIRHREPRKVPAGGGRMGVPSPPSSDEAPQGPEGLPDLPELPPLPGEQTPGEPDGASDAPAPADLDELDRRLRELDVPLEDGNDETPTPSALTFMQTGDEPGDGGMMADANAPGATTPPAPWELDDAARRPMPGWIRVNGRWQRVQQGSEPADRQPGQEGRRRFADSLDAFEATQDDPYGWGKVDQSFAGRIIAINRRKLENGDPRMNVVIREDDVVQVPVLEVAEFYLAGEVNRPGVYSLTGRKVTVKQALGAAAGVGPLGWPENSILIRRVGENEEQIIPLDLEAIWRGDQADIYLKKDDIIAVGSDIRAPFIAVLRNAFRVTYGFGFIYDRNFAFPASGETTLNSKRFTRW